MIATSYLLSYCRVTVHLQQDNISDGIDYLKDPFNNTNWDVKDIGLGVYGGMWAYTGWDG